jgi:DNA gyrase subunit A
MNTKDEDAVTKLFVTSTHTPVLFFSTHGKVYRLKVWRLPEGAPQARGRPMVNLLPLAAGETISTVLPLPEDENEWKNLHIMFATAKGIVRRNSMDAFTRVPTAGKIAMRFGETEETEDVTDRLIGVTLLTEEDDVFLATRSGRAIRFAATDVREFQSRTAAGVRGARLQDGDEVISVSILKGFKANTEERDEYLRHAPWRERSDDAPPPPPREMSDERFEQFRAAEEFILTVCANGYGKRSSAYEYRRIGRGGQGITNIGNLERNGPVVASFPAHNGEQLMLVTDQAKLIRMSVGDTRVIGRGSAGVRLFHVSENEHVVSAARIDESEEPENEAEALIAEELSEPAAPVETDQVQLDDGTGPQTLSERVEEDNDEDS